MAKIVLHLKNKDISRNLEGWRFQLYKAVREMAEEAGIDLEIKARDADIRVGTRIVYDGRFNDGNLHLIDDRSVRAPNVLNAGVSHFKRFWHLDRNGVKAFSSIGNRQYCPDLVPHRRATTFYERMRERYVEKRASKYTQPAEVQTFQQGAISVFFQGTYPLASGASNVTDLEMLKTVLEQSVGQQIIVKPHPLSSTTLEMEKLKALAKRDERVVVSNANVHDILEASIATVSMNSAVALEGFLHATPAILFGRSEMHHFSSRVTNKLSFKAALSQELLRKEGYAQYVAWYLLKNCLSMNSGRLIQKIWDEFRDAGFPEERFGVARQQ